MNDAIPRQRLQVDYLCQTDDADPSVMLYLKLVYQAGSDEHIDPHRSCLYKGDVDFSQPEATLHYIRWTGEPEIDGPNVYMELQDGTSFTLRIDCPPGPLPGKRLTPLHRIRRLFRLHAMLDKREFHRIALDDVDMTFESNDTLVVAPR